jgi:hypothetical protein
MESLSFSLLKVWYSIRVQNKSLVDIGKVNPAQCLFAQPPPLPTAVPATKKPVYKLGRYDTALFVNDLSEEFTGKTDLKGNSYLFGVRYSRVCLHQFTAHTIGQLRLIFQPISNMRGPQGSQPYLMYVQRFDKVHKVEPTGLQRLQRKFVDAEMTERYGGVVDLIRLRKPVEVCPYFGQDAHSGLTVENSMEISNEFTLNHSGDPEDDYIFS